MSQNGNLIIKDADGGVRAILYCHENLLCNGTSQVIHTAVTLSKQKLFSLRYELDAKRLAALITIAAWESGLLIVPATQTNWDVDFNVEVVVESSERIVVNTCSRLKYDKDDHYVIEDLKPEEASQDQNSV